jgi:hypothetical protein
MLLPVVAALFQALSIDRSALQALSNMTIESIGILVPRGAACAWPLVDTLFCHITVYALGPFWLRLCLHMQGLHMHALHLHDLHAHALAIAGVALANARAEHA